MRLGLEGDTRKFKRLRHSDYYALKAAEDASKREPRSFRPCRTCRQPITGQDYNGYCLRCKDEPL